MGVYVCVWTIEGVTGQTDRAENSAVTNGATSGPQGPKGHFPGVAITGPITSSFKDLHANLSALLLNTCLHVPITHQAPGNAYDN